MPQQIAGIMALLAFALCLVVGGFEADNPFTTTVLRALLAMAGTYVIAWLIGTMAQKMLDENLKAEEEKLKNNSAKPPPQDR